MWGKETSLYQAAAAACNRQKKIVAEMAFSLPSNDKRLEEGFAILRDLKQKHTAAYIRWWDFVGKRREAVEKGGIEALLHDELGALLRSGTRRGVAADTLSYLGSPLCSTRALLQGARAELDRRREERRKKHHEYVLGLAELGQGTRCL